MYSLKPTANAARDNLLDNLLFSLLVVATVSAMFVLDMSLSKLKAV